MQELADAVIDSAVTTRAVEVVGVGALATNAFASNAFGVATDVVTFAGGVIAIVAGIYLIRRHDTQRELDKLRMEEIYRLRDIDEQAQAGD